jgi:hypothetical protein
MATPGGSRRNPELEYVAMFFSLPDAAGYGLAHEYHLNAS